MSASSAFLIACASAMGFSHPPADTIRAIEVACGSDASCQEDAVLYAAHESGFSEGPVAISWDAKAHVSCGTWQTPCNSKDRTVLDRARTWVALRRVSLETWGDLRGLAGATDAGVRLTRYREAEREDMLFGATWGVP